MKNTTWLCALFLLPGCDALLGDDTGTNGVSDSGSSATTHTSTTGTGSTTPAEWSTSNHPCAGNRTDVMWWDTDNTTVWVGCGTTTIGTGLFFSDDAGKNWQTPGTRPDAFFDDFRVSSIQRSSDNLLYVAGTRVSGSELVVQIDTAASPMVVESVFDWGGQLWNSFHVGTFRRNDDGFAVAESLTGTSLAFRTGDDAPWQDGYGFRTDGETTQILDMVLHDNVFYGCGATIAKPPTVYLPTTNTAPFKLRAVELASWIGELWGIDVDDEGIIVGGVNQNRNVGMVFWSGADATETSDWTSFDVSTVVGESSSTWIRGVCRAPGLWVAVGEYSQTNNALMLVSKDSGTTWQDWTGRLPGSPSALQKCEAWADGTLAVTGMDGYFASSPGW